MEPVLIITNFPDKKGAMALAHQLINDRLAACISIQAASTAVYRWQEQVETADEVPILIKTQHQHYNQVEQVIKALHPYELPEIIVVPINNGLPAYLQWIIDETQSFDSTNQVNREN